MLLTPFLQMIGITGTSGFEDSTIQSLLLMTFKILFTASALIYFTFAIIVIRQIKLMKSTVITTLAPVLSAVGYVHLLVSFGVLILMFILL